MRKKNYTICLDKEHVDLVKAVLSLNGVSFSGFINAVMENLALTIKSSIKDKGGFKDLTLSEVESFISEMHNIVQNAEESLHRAKQSEPQQLPLPVEMPAREKV